MPDSIGPTRLSPAPWQPNYLVLRSLTTLVRAQIGLRLTQGEQIELIDVGCGLKPYKPLFNEHAARYVGVDLHAGPAVDVEAPAERLPFTDESFDWAICMQVLEHVESPADCVAELCRVVRKGGVVLASTHGVFRYHPNPTDYWRWTHAGLEKLFRDNGTWREVTVYPNGGIATALANLIATELWTLASKTRSELLWRPLFLAMNVAASHLDRRLGPRYARRPATLVSNFLVVAERE